jgi:hypothetical protein
MFQRDVYLRFQQLYSQKHHRILRTTQYKNTHLWQDICLKFKVCPQIKVGELAYHTRPRKCGHPLAHFPMEIDDEQSELERGGGVSREMGELASNGCARAANLHTETFPAKAR